MSTLKVDQLEAATASTITVPSGQTLDISSATLTPPATMPASSAANLTSIPAANITGTIAAVSGANLTALNATQLTSGTVPDDRFPATLPAKSGVNLTALNATNLGSGSVSTSRFPAGTVVQFQKSIAATDASIDTSSTTLVASGFTCSITPLFSSSIIVVELSGISNHQNLSGDDSGVAIEVKRSINAGSYGSCVPAMTGGNRIEAPRPQTDTGAYSWRTDAVTVKGWDDPDTTSEIIYQVYFKGYHADNAYLAVPGHLNDTRLRFLLWEITT